MGLLTLRRLLSAGLLLSVSLVHAQSDIEAVTTAPNNAASIASTFQFNSVFTQYRKYTEQPVLPWREANDDVGKIGGWRFYAKEASQPEAEGKSPNKTDSHSEHGRKP